MRALITGGSGFIGCNAAVGFKSRGYEVLCVDNHSRPLVERNADWLLRDHQIPTERLDVRNPNAAGQVVRRLRPDVVLHCAGQVAVTSSVATPRRDFEDNALGTFNVLEAVRLHAPNAVVLYPSTNKVYGAMEDVGVETRDGRYCYSDLPFGCAETRPLDFHSPYGCSKGAADQYVHDYARIYGLRTVVFRQSCIYGYRQFGLEDQGWVAWFAIRAAQRAPVTIYGDGRQVRDVLFIDDLVEAYLSAVARIELVRGRVYNIGGGPSNRLSLLDLLTRLEGKSGHPLPVRFEGWRPGDQKVFVSDVRKAKAELAWEPRTGVADGVARLYEWVCANLELFGKPAASADER